jgi:FlaA1/EpsC-like NDP-sugar epimerase
MEQLTAFSGRQVGARRVAVRFVNVLGSAGSASELFLRQARADVALTVTETGMLRYWITQAHAAAAAAQAPLLADEGYVLAAPADAVQLTVGELAERIWLQTGHEGAPLVDVVGIRPGETLSEALTASGETIAATSRQGVAPIAGEVPSAAPAWVLERLPERASREEARAVWLEALRRPGLLVPAAAAAQ